MTGLLHWRNGMCCCRRSISVAKEGCVWQRQRAQAVMLLCLLGAPTSV